MSERDLDPIKSRRVLIDSFLKQTGELIDRQAKEFSAGAAVSVESASFIRPESINEVVALAAILVEAAADEIQSFIRLTAHPVQTRSPFTCVRACLESSALAAWMLAPNIGDEERVKRSMAYLYEGFVQQKKLFRIDQISQTIESTPVA